MKAFIVSDMEYHSETSDKINTLLTEYLKERHFEVEVIQIDRDDLKPCMGCFGCWIKKPGECVINDDIALINHRSMSSDAVFYICPIVFGEYSASMKNVIDRWLPNMLPFFEIRPDGSTIHPPRYKDYPQQVMIGYSELLSDDDAQLFKDITNKHRNNVEVVIYNEDKAKLLSALNAIDLKRVGGHL